MNQITYEVDLTRYPERFTVKADSREEAVRKAKAKADFSVFESTALEVEE